MINTLNAAIVETPTTAKPTETERLEVERLIAAVKAGDREAWLQLLHMTPVVDRTNRDTGQTYPPMPDEVLSCEYIYEY